MSDVANLKDEFKQENGESSMNDDSTNFSVITPWIKTIFDTYKKCKEELFGDGSTINIKQRRLMDYTVLPNYKFVIAKYKDGLYRPASIIGRSKKLLLFIVYFYHSKKCCYLKPRNVIFKHGNLLDRRVCFKADGHKKKGTVFGNNSPANHGIPTIFYIKRKKSVGWYKVGFKNIFLTKKQVNNMYFKRPKRRVSGNICKQRSSSARNHKSE